MSIDKGMAFAVASAVAVLLQPVADPSRGSVAAASIQLVPVLTGLSSPLLVTNARDGSNRLFVVERGGVIKVMAQGAVSPTVFLDISAQVQTGTERGLLGLTFHPNFASNRRFFVNYTRKPDGAIVVAEYQVSMTDPDVANSVERVLLVIAKPFASHNGGMIEFGPDGYLYIATGDGGSENDSDNRAQDIEQLLGKILRIDVDPADEGLLYSSPPSNPFFGATAGRAEIYAYGFRNPWRFSFDRVTGTLYAGDVGQSAREEINVVTLGGNYGWRIWEGTSCTGNDPELCTTSGFTFPIAEYAHTAGRCAVTGGYVYRGAMGSLPSGAYVHGDFCSGEVFLLQSGSASVALDSGLSISSFGEDEAGEIYVVGLGGAVYRIAAAPTCNVSLTPNGQSVPVGGVQAAVIQVTAPAGCDWTASTTAAWITITSGQSGSGDSQVVFDVSSNQENTTMRTGVITIAGAGFAVTQPGCTYALGTKRRSVPVGGIELAEVAVIARTGCEWSARSNASWITIRSGHSGSGDGRVAFEVAPNHDSTSARTGTLTIAGRTFTIVQAGCTFALGANTRLAPPGGIQGASVRVNTIAGCGWTARSNAAWITIVSGHNGIGDGRVVFDVAPNQGAIARSGTLTIAGRTYTVKQAAP